MRKKILIGTVLLFVLGGCGSTTASTEQNTKTETPAVTEEPAPVETGKTLVVYFSSVNTAGSDAVSSATPMSGDTSVVEAIAQEIASVTNGDVFTLNPEIPYTNEDLNYNNDSCRANLEQNDDTSRPAFVGSIEDWDSYATVYIGSPIWWGKEPRILDTFVESYSFADKTVIPFCTSGGSGISTMASNLQSLADGGTWLEGKRFAGVNAGKIDSWATSNGG